MYLYLTCMLKIQNFRHVSEKLVAAFAKRLSRLSLVAQAADLVLLMQFVGNLLIRHPALLVMVHSPVVESSKYISLSFLLYPL